MDTELSMKNNLIQNFYIIGLSPNDFFHQTENNTFEFINIFGKDNQPNLTPKIISKFPPKEKSFSEIIEQIIIKHCFPDGLTLIKDNVRTKPQTNFEFELDNIYFNYSSLENKFSSKQYFTCIEIYEPLIQYCNYKQDIINNNKNLEIVNKIDDIDESALTTFVPKVLCFSSKLPFNNELNKILNIIYNQYQNNNNNSNNLPIEKLIEQIVLKIPLTLII